jgi:biotin carboxyl carrier protein
MKPDDGRPPRTARQRAADHAAIDRLSNELLPALIAKLGATGLGELEVREGAWRVRLRRPAEGASGHDRRPADRDRGERSAGRSASGAGTTAHAHAPATLTPVGPGRDGRDGRDGAIRDGASRDESRMIASSPGVGIFQPRADIRAGSRVRAGDRLGSVDVLGIPQEVVAPADGIVGVSLAEPGDAVEYGQDLVVIEFASPAGPSTPAATAPEA